MPSDEKKSSWKWKAIKAALILGAVSCLLFGFALRQFIVPSVVMQQVSEQSVLKDGSRLMRKWMDPEYKFEFNVWAHSVKNPDEILAGSIPEVKTSGPYVFDKKLENKVISHQNGTVKFKRFNFYHFNETASCETCILGNRVWVPNIIYQKFIEAASMEFKLAATALVKQTAFLEVEVGELLFDGYKDPFLDEICNLPFMNFVCESILDTPDRIGILYGTNATDDGVYEIDDGSSDVSNLAKMLRWKGSNHVDDNWWSTEDARLIRGTEGNLFPPFVSKDKRLYVFITQLCRSVYLEYKEEVVYRGVPAYRFILPGEVFDQSLEENKGYCNPTVKSFFASQGDDKCMPKGLLEISRCQKGMAPIVISLPNFLFATDEVRKSVIGMEEPDEQTDTIFVDIEPTIGAVLTAHRVFQVNVEMWKGKNITFPVNLSKSRSCVVPVVTVREYAYIDETSLNEIKSELIETRKLAYSSATAISLFSIPLFIAFVLVSLYKSDTMFKMCKKHKRDAISPLPAYKPNPDYTPTSYT